MKKHIITALSLAMAFLSVSCDKSSPMDPTEMTAGFTVTVVPPVVTIPADAPFDCRIKFAANARGGKPPHTHKWDFGALLVRAVQRVGTDGDQLNEFIGSQAAVGLGTYAIKLEVSDSGKEEKKQTRIVNGFVNFRCSPGDQPSTFSF
jgi:hypothetical protein